MAERQVFPEWRDARGSIAAPFADQALVPDNLGRVFVDAAVYLPGGSGRAWLSAIEVSDERAVVTVSNGSAEAAGAIVRQSGGDIVNLTAKGRPAGVLVGNAPGIPGLFSLKYGKTEYTAEQTLFAAGVVYPVPFDGVLSVNGLSGVVPLVGEHGVRLGLDGDMILVDVVGTREAAGTVKPTGLRTISLIAPDSKGAFRFVSSRRLASDSILRITAGESRVTFSLAETKP